MAVVAESEPRLGPDLGRARELARDADVVPVSYRFVDDCETPVSAFLKLREAFPGPSFLLESAEQGRLGRYSFLGFRPRVELLSDPQRIGAKVREEADEVATAAAGESDERVAEEAADLLYHLEVLLLSRDVPLSAALETLNGRRR